MPIVREQREVVNRLQRQARLAFRKEFAPKIATGKSLSATEKATVRRIYASVTRANTEYHKTLKSLRIPDSELDTLQPLIDASDPVAHLRPIELVPFAKAPGKTIAAKITDDGIELLPKRKPGEMWVRAKLIDKPKVVSSYCLLYTSPSPRDS